MKTFHCENCGQATFFENVRCLKCRSELAFVPERLALCSIEPVPGRSGLWQRRARRKGRGGSYLLRLCINSTNYEACNFAVPEHDPNPLCVSCRQTRVLPDLSMPENRTRWYRVEVAKRRLFYTLAKLRLVDVSPPAGQRDGPIFEFLADTPVQAVMTGHINGLITLNIAEADDAERFRRRVTLREPYRTLLGHLRHESGHYYWDRLVRDGGRTAEFRAMFGDESRDYNEALQQYYASGGSIAGWDSRHVSAYATSHPWEDWAETWAHYLHMVDLLETAASYNTHIALPGDHAAEEMMNPFASGAGDFKELVEQWVPLTLLVNSLNRSLGQDDAYPFALSPAALDKLRYVHEVIRAHSSQARNGPQQAVTDHHPAPSREESCPAGSTTALS